MLQIKHWKNAAMATKALPPKWFDAQGLPRLAT